MDIRLNQGELTSRYRYVTDANENTTTSQLEDKVVLDATVLFGKDGRVPWTFLLALDPGRPAWSHAPRRLGPVTILARAPHS